MSVQTNYISKAWLPHVAGGCWFGQYGSWSSNRIHRKCVHHSATRGLLVPESEQVLRKALPSKQSKVFQAKEVQNVSCEEVKDVKPTVPNKRQVPGDTVKRLPTVSSLQLVTSVFPSLLDHSHKCVKHVNISPVENKTKTSWLLSPLRESISFLKNKTQKKLSILTMPKLSPLILSWIHSKLGFGLYLAPKTILVSDSSDLRIAKSNEQCSVLILMDHPGGF